MPSRQNDELHVIVLMDERHRKRQAAIDSQGRDRYILLEKDVNALLIEKSWNLLGKVELIFRTRVIHRQEMHMRDEIKY
jgi:hypothetical protein